MLPICIPLAIQARPPFLPSNVARHPYRVEFRRNVGIIILGIVNKVHYGIGLEQQSQPLGAIVIVRVRQAMGLA